MQKSGLCTFSRTAIASSQWHVRQMCLQASYGPRCSIFAIVTGDNSGPPTNNFPLYTAGFKTLYDSGVAYVVMLS